MVENNKLTDLTFPVLNSVGNYVAVSLVLMLSCVHFYIAIATPHIRFRFLVWPPLCVKCVNAGIDVSMRTCILSYPTIRVNICKHACMVSSTNKWFMPCDLVNCFTIWGGRVVSIATAPLIHRWLKTTSSPTSHSRFLTALATMSQ